MSLLIYLSQDYGRVPGASREGMVGFWTQNGGQVTSNELNKNRNKIVQ